MFSIDLMKHFYDPNYENDDEVINAWYLYVLKFLPLVNKKWRDACATDKLRNETSMFLFVTISDEALMRWFLHIWMQRLLNKMNRSSIKNVDKSCSSKEIVSDASALMETTHDSNSPFDAPVIKHSVKRGPHDTNARVNMYTALHHEITMARRNYDTAVRWNVIFWNEVKKRNASDLEVLSSSSKYGKFTTVGDLPLPDFNENQEFLASYVIQSNQDSIEQNKCDQNEKASAILENQVAQLTHV